MNDVIVKAERGRVAAILNARELVINLGNADGVTKGMRFAVLADEPIAIRDPESGDVLDTLDREKVRVRAKEVRERITICETYRMKGARGAVALASNWAKIITEEMQKPQRETFHISDDSTLPPLTEEESYVKINDRVRAIEDEND
ncbi:hypothetical protein GC176_11640 [bacterium]|nr:hypothetical protein [bacterium]